VVEKSNSGQEKDMSYADDEGVNRPKLSLQPRGSTADNMSSPSPAKTSRVSVRSFPRLRSVIFDSGVLPEDFRRCHLYVPVGRRMVLHAGTLKVRSRVRLCLVYAMHKGLPSGFDLIQWFIYFAVKPRMHSIMHENVMVSDEHNLLTVIMKVLHRAPQCWGYLDLLCFLSL
jgi:hypothetical protein